MFELGVKLKKDAPVRLKGMHMKEALINILTEVIEELNDELEYETLNVVNESTPLFGGEDGIDSISLARLISDIELAISEKMNFNVILADEKAMSMRLSPYRTVGTLTEFVLSRLAVIHG